MADVLEQLPARRGVEPTLQPGDGLLVHVCAAQMQEGLDRQTTDFPGRGHPPGRGMLQDDLAATDLDRAGRPFRQVGDLHGHLRGQPQQIGRIGPRGLDAQPAPPREGRRDVVGRWLQRPQFRMALRIVVQAPGQLTNQPGLLMPLQGGRHRVAGADFLEIAWGEHPTPLVAIDLRK